MLGRYGGAQLVATAYPDKNMENFDEKMQDFVRGISVDEKKETVIEDNSITS